MSKMLVAFGANAGLVGLFLPTARGVEHFTRVESSSPPLWQGLTAPDPTDRIDLFLLGLFVVMALLALWMLQHRFSRAKALCLLALAIPAQALAVYLIVYHLRALPPGVLLGPGLSLTAVGGGLVILGALLALVRPERTEPEDDAHPQPARRNPFRAQEVRPQAARSLRPGGSTKRK